VPAGAIRVTGVSYSFGDVAVLDGLDLEVGGGETVALVGPSGCGKSTLLELIGGLLPLGAGAIAVGGDSSAAGRTKGCTWMPQSDLLLPWKTAVDNAAIALRLHGAETRGGRRRATGMLTRLGVGDFAEAYPRELSGGMRQRVAFARTLLAGTPALLLDEPFASLDAITRADLQRLLVATLRDERRTTLLVTHDVEEALYVADRVAVLSPRPGRLVWTIDSPSSGDRDLPRAAAISRPDFVAAREQALEILGQGDDR
jgi:ABC-type nitrate/sulfonate/bicarbonate transport system ATPase subunit